MSLPATLDQLFAFEQILEDGFVNNLTVYGLSNVQSSRSQTVFNAPYISLWYQNGAVVESNQHQVAFSGVSWPGRMMPFNSYTGVLTTELVTNRTVTNATPHTTLIAQMRAAMQLFNVYKNWNQDILYVLDIREGGTVDTWEDEQGLDHTTITWNMIHSINEAAWPDISYDVSA